MGVYQSIEMLESLRKKHNFYQKITMFSMPIMMIGMLIFSWTPFVMFFMIGIAAGISLCAIKMNSYKHEFQAIYKEMFAREALNGLLDNVEYNWQRGFSEMEVASFDIVRMGNRFKSEDYLKASYKGVEFEQADVTVKYRSSGKNSSTTTYFRGKMLSIRVSPKKAKMLQVFTDNFPYRANTGYKMNKIEMEDVEFNKLFDVKAYDEHEAFYILTPQFMERLKSLTGRYSSIAFHFKMGALYIAMNTTWDTFDADFRYEVTYPKEMEKMEVDIREIKDIIDALGLADE